MQNFPALEQNPKDILRQIVVDELGESITDFQHKCGYKTYAHAWGLLKGEVEITDATLGRFLRAYGPKAAGRVAAALPAIGANGST